MKHKTGKAIMGATLGLATIAVAIDYTRHQLPEVEEISEDTQQQIMEQGTPCGLGGAPCSLGEGGSLDDL